MEPFMDILRGNKGGFKVGSDNNKWLPIFFAHTAKCCKVDKGRKLIPLIDILAII